MPFSTSEERHKGEKEFHDSKFSDTHKKSHYEVAFNSIIIQRMLKEIGSLEGRRILEFGCGTGWFTRKLARLGGEVSAFDISEEAVKRVQTLLASEGLADNVHIDQMAGEELLYEDDTFDFVIGVAVLHHLELESSIKEIKRVLKKGGKAYFAEPLGHNPFLNAFRYVTPQLRTKDEFPMRFEQFEELGSVFDKFQHEEYYLTAFSALGLYFLGLKGLVLKGRDVLHKLDKAILSAWPRLSKYCWYTLLIMEK